MSSSSSSSDSTLGLSSESLQTENVAPTPEYEWIDHELKTYRIQKQRWGTYTSFLADGTAMVTGGSEEAVRVCTEDIHLPFYFGEDSSDIKTTEYTDTGSETLA